MELPLGLIQPLERLPQTARPYVHPADMHVVEGPPKTSVTGGGRVWQTLPPAQTSAGSACTCWQGEVVMPW